MGQWKELPYEVQVEIVKELQYDDGSWPSANKQMYTMFQSIDYDCISIEVGNPNDERLDAILNSCFSPRQWVKDWFWKNFLHQRILAQSIQQMIHSID